MKLIYKLYQCFRHIVAPLVGAWIEIDGAMVTGRIMQVAPLVGACIEMITIPVPHLTIMSLPSWERGLKYNLASLFFQCGDVAPLVGAWIEIVLPRETGERHGSLPLWERELK